MAEQQQPYMATSHHLNIHSVHTNTVTTHIQSILAFLCANEASKKLYDISNPPLTLSIDNSHN